VRASTCCIFSANVLAGLSHQHRERRAPKDPEPWPESLAESSLSRCKRNEKSEMLALSIAPPHSRDSEAKKNAWLVQRPKSEKSVHLTALRLKVLTTRRLANISRSNIVWTFIQFPMKIVMKFKVKIHGNSWNFPIF
jgi:hypothetical protein